MTTKHTPGPWAFIDTGLVFAGKNRLHVAQVATTGMGYQAAGNARLIAAAPELLHALRIGLHHTQRAADRARGLAQSADLSGMHGTAQHHRDAAAESDAAADVIRAAIETATGEEA